MLQAPSPQIDIEDRGAGWTRFMPRVLARVAGTQSPTLAKLKDILTGAGERQKVQRAALTAFAIRCISAGLLYLTQVFMARWMGAFDYGIYVSVWTWVLILGGMSQLGLNMAASRLIPEHRARHETDLLFGFIAGSRLLVTGWATVLTAAALAGVWLFQDHFSNHYVIPIYLALVCVPMFALTDLQDGIGRAHRWMGIALLPPFVLRPLFVLLGMIAAALSGLPMTATTAVAAAIIATYAAALFQFVALGKALAREPAPATRRYSFKAWLGVSLSFIALISAELVMQNADVLTVSVFMTPADVGVYFAAAKTMALILFVHFAVTNSVASRFATLKASGDTEALKTAVRDSVKWTFWPSLCGAIVILVIGQPLLWLFGPEFARGYGVMTILVVGFMVRASFGPCDAVLNMLGEERRCAFVLTSTAIANIALNVGLVPHFGLLGAATASAIALAGGAFASSWVVKQRFGIDMAIWKTY